MNYNCFFLIILFELFSLGKSIEYGLNFDVNDGETKNITTAYIAWIKTKITKDSQIIVEIINYDKNRIINKEDIEYSTYDEAKNKTDFSKISMFISNNNKYTCTYEIEKKNNDHGVLKITNLGFAQLLNIKVTVISKTTYWFIIVIVIVVVLLVLFVLFLLLRKFSRCCRS